MADLLEVLMELLCQQGTLSKCENFVYAYPDVLNQVLFFLFFPSVFIILFIYLLSDAITHGTAAKFKTLVGIAVFVFIVVQGWYHYFLLFGKWWFMAVIILGGFFIVVHKMGLRNGGGGGGGGEGRAVKKGANWAKEAVFGNIQLDPRKFAADKRVAQQDLKRIEGDLRALKENYKNAKSDREETLIRDEILKLEADQRELKEVMKGRKGREKD